MSAVNYTSDTVSSQVSGVLAEGAEIFPFVRLSGIYFLCVGDSVPSPIAEDRIKRFLDYVGVSCRDANTYQTITCDNIPTIG